MENVALNTPMAELAKRREEQHLERKLQKIGVLILDSSEQVTELFKNMFLQFGLTNVFTANDGFQGIQILKEFKIHLVLTDWELQLRSNTEGLFNGELPPLSGISFVERLRQAPSSPNPFLPVIMLVDNGEKTQIMRARDAGVNEIVMKPLSAEELCKRIISIISTPRIFITSDNYKGPCRRHNDLPIPGNEERRKLEVKVIKHNGKH